jgi:ribosomal protein L32
MSNIDPSCGLRRLLHHKGKTCNLYKENPAVRGGKTL